MSFSEKFLPVWHIIESAIKKAGANAIRVDNLPDVDDIFDTIFRKIRESDVLLAECTINPDTVNSMLNVVMEIQCAREKNIPVIIITQSNPAELPFDLRVKNAIMYNENKEGLDLLEFRIKNRIKSALKFEKKVKIKWSFTKNNSRIKLQNHYSKVRN